jgi:hypothetical protein
VTLLAYWPPAAGFLWSAKVSLSVWCDVAFAQDSHEGTLWCILGVDLL